MRIEVYIAMCVWVILIALGIYKKRINNIIGISIICISLFFDYFFYISSKTAQELVINSAYFSDNKGTFETQFDKQFGIEIDPNLKDGKDTILHIAIHNNRLYIVKKLLDRGANPYVRNSEGLTAIQVARKMKNKNMEILLEQYLY